MFRSQRPSVLIFSWMLLANTAAIHAQTQRFALNGVVKSRDTRLLMPGTTIVAKDTLAKDQLGYRASTLSDRRGKYKLELPYDGVYRVEYQAQGHVTKRLILDLTDTRQKDREGGDEMHLEITMFTMLDQVDYKAFDQPIAVCRYDRKQKKFAWDEEYGERRKGELEVVNNLQDAALRAGASPAGQPQEPSLH